MSRTDKDAPAWVRARNAPHAVDHHTYGCPFNNACMSLPPGHERECDIGTRDGLCYRWDRDHHGYYWDRPTRAEIHVSFYGPERAHVRDTLRAARRDHNTYGETEVEPVSRQHRRSTFSGDYWD